jgi:hypothetical protein
MPRLKQLPEEGVRRTVTFRPDLDEMLAVMAARRRVPISTIVEELLERGLLPAPDPEVFAIDFPPNWDGSDLRRRLYYLRMRQAELARRLGIADATLNHWICGRCKFDQAYLPRIQQAMKDYEPPSIDDFRIGSRNLGDSQD